MIVRKIWEDGEKERPSEKLLISEDETETIALGYVSVEPDGITKTGFHDDEEEIYVILKGRAILTVGEEKKEVGPGSVAYVPRNNKHNMKCISDEKLEYLYFANYPDTNIK
jgi:quercetin dioxygenase-like cupin family protein